MDGQRGCECPSCGGPSIGWCAGCRSYDESIDDEAAVAERVARERDEEREVRRLRGD